jgi:hypothetical protein
METAETLEEEGERLLPLIVRVYQFECGWGLGATFSNFSCYYLGLSVVAVLSVEPDMG